MKKRGFGLYLIFLGFLLLLCMNSCKRGRNGKNDLSLKFDSATVSETYYLSNDTTKPGCNLKMDFIYPVKCNNKIILERIQNIFISKFLGNSFAGNSIDSALTKYKEKYISEFKRFEKEAKTEDLLDNDEEDEEVDDNGYSYYTTIKNKITYYGNNILSFTVDYSNYQEGAHGSHSINGYVINLKTGTLITEDQIFGDNYEENISNAIVSKIAENNGLKDPKDLENIGYNSVDDISPNGNFVVDEKGITYYYNENEIAAYVIGTIKVFMPYNEINIYLKSENNPIYPLFNK